MAVVAFLEWPIVKVVAVIVAGIDGAPETWRPNDKRVPGCADQWKWYDLIAVRVIFIETELEGFEEEFDRYLGH